MKKLIFLITLALFSYSNTILSQPVIFSRVIFHSSIGVHVNDLIHSFDNGYILAGNKDYQNGMIIKIDSECNEIWAKEIFTSIELNSILRTNDSCFVISGNALNPDTYNRDALCMKIASDGDTLWTTTIGGDDSKNILSSYQTYDSGYIITGRANTGEVDGVYVAKLDLAGNVLWSRSIRLGNHYNTGYSIKQLSDSSYLVTGSMLNYPPYEGYPFLLNLSETGEINWVKKYITDDLRGEGYDFIVTDTGFLVYLNINYYVSFLHTDYAGNVLWNRSYNLYSENYNNEVSPKLYRTSDNYLLGVVGSEWDFGRMFKLDMETNAMWFSELFLNPVNVTETVSGEYFVYGNGPLLGVKNSNSVNPQVGFIQMDSMGNGTECVYNASNTFIVDTILSDTISYTITSNYTITDIPIEIDDQTLSLRDGCVDFIGGVDEENITNELVIFPNPATGIFNISLLDQETGRLTIFNNFGQIIYKNSIVKEIKVDLSAQPPGVYHYLFGADDGKQFSGKLVITN